MRKVAILAAALAVLVGAANAEEINLFWSSTGLSGVNLTYSTALTNFQPAYQPPNPVGELVPGAMYDLFLWGRFPAGWENYRIYGLDLKWGPGNTAYHDINVAYRHTWGAAPSEKRWDGSSGTLLDGAMDAGSASGIIWDTNGGAYHLMQPDGQFLIGAARIYGDLLQHAVVSLDSPPSGLGISVRDSFGNEVPAPTVIPADVLFYPEPTSILMLAVGLLVRHRRRSAPSRNQTHGRGRRARSG
jgi:hypothetical protein